MSKSNLKITASTICDGTPFIGKLEIGFTDVIPDLPLLIQKSWEQEILKNGIQTTLNVRVVDTDPVTYVLVTGHFEYEMALKHSLPFNITLRKFETDDDVIRFIITGTLYREHLNTFQKGELVLRYKYVLASEGKENMRKGGKGIKISENVDTMVQLAHMIGSSHDTLRKVQYLLNTLKPNDDRLKKLREGELKINGVHEEISGKQKNTKKNPVDDFFSVFEDNTNTNNTSINIHGDRKVAIKSKFHIDETDKYQVVYMKPKWDISNAITMPDTHLVELRRMNISDIVYNKFCTLLIETPSKYLGDTLEIIASWGFKCVDSICISNPTTLYSSKYSEQNHEILLVCELDVASIPQTYIKNRPSCSIINSEDVMNTINGMFDKNISKVCIFSEPIEGWDSYDFDNESKMMIKFYNKAA
jgi:hypothetical protein